MTSAEGKSEEMVPNYEITIRKEHLEDDIRELLKMLRPSWPPEKIQLKEQQGGIVNVMYCCWSSLDLKDKVVVRVYPSLPEVVPEGANLANAEFEVGFERGKEARNLEKIRLSGLGPQMSATFTNGLCYKYIEGETLNVDRIREPELIPHVTKIIAQLHALPLMTGKSETWNTAFLRTILPQFPPKMKPERLERLAKLVPDVKTIEKELDHLDTVIPHLGTPRVFCHNDLKGENFIWNKESGTLKLIDFEHASNNCQAYDLGHHFYAYSDVKAPDSTKYPKKEFQLVWLRMYLEHWFDATGRKARDVTDKDVETLYVQINKSAQLSRLLVGIGCLYLDGMGMFDCFEFCMQSLEDYFKYKDQIDGLKIPD